MSETEGVLILPSHLSNLLTGTCTLNPLLINLPDLIPQFMFLSKLRTTAAANTSNNNNNNSNNTSISHTPFAPYAGSATVLSSGQSPIQSVIQFDCMDASHYVFEN